MYFSYLVFIFVHEHRRRVQLAKQGKLTPPGHLVSPLACYGLTMLNLVLYYSELTLTDVVYNSSLPDNAPVGYTFMTFNLTDIDFEEITYNFTHSYLSVNETSNEIILTTALPRDNSLGSSTLTLVAYDTCQHTVSVTFSVSIYNEVPSINNLPATLSLPESTPNSTRLFELDTSDLSGDPVCCVLSDVIPRTDNFVLEYDNVTEKYYVYTSTTAQFGYWKSTSYQLVICCDDGHIYTKQTLTLKIPKPKTRSVPPRWIYLAIGLSMIPITVSFCIAGGILIMTFLLEDYAT
ncbi:hypothetical protein FSP39_003356 [Pinctada imbricata]|uniref:Cadherin domain-containing protein n=1 Tax=Pinctada imbricata TaxID=66713 RepID=A0AA88YS59_PINIB|nr:hypothetical protein FSP39_003356 [Pinctada imbricata]